MKMKFFWIVLGVFFAGIIPAHPQFFVNQNANVFFGNNIVVQINTDLTLSNGSNLTQSGTGTIYITGNWTNNGGSFNPGTGVVIFTGGNNSTISGTSLTNFYNLTINKNNSLLIVLLNNDANVQKDLQIQQGIFRLGNSNFVRLVVYGDATVSSNGLFDVTDNLPAAADTAKFGGNLIVNGALDFNGTNGKVFAFFINSGNADFDGTGTADFFEILLRKNSKGDTVFFKRSFTAPDGFLTLDTGFFKIIGNFSLTNTFFKPQTGTGNIFIQKESGFWLDNPNITVQGQPLQGNLYLRGDLVLSQGTFNVGSTGESSLIYDNSTPSKSRLDVRGGQLNIWTRLAPQTYATNLIDFSFTSGKINIGVGSQSTISSVGMFDISATGSSLTWSSDTIELRRTANNTVADYVVLASTYNVTGGVLKINSAVSGQTFEINSTVPVYNFELQGTNDPIAKLVSNNFNVLNDVTFAGNGTGRLNANGLSLTLGGNWTNNCATADGFVPAGGTVVLNGSLTQNIGGTQTTKFYNLHINKTSGDVEVNQPIRVDGNLRLISNTLVDLNSNDLTIGPSGHIYSDNGTSEDVITFNSNKYLVNSGSSGNPLLGARVIREISTSATLPLNLHFPVGTPNRYTPAVISINSGGATFGSNPWVSVKPVPQEHPEVEQTGKSLTKYWVVARNDVNINTGGASVRFYYQGSEVQGTESSYAVLWYSPSYNDPNGYWRVNPGVNNYVDNSNNLFYSLQVNEINGDWSAGEPDAAYAVFYSRANGNFNDPNTWSLVNFGGTASTKAPSKKNHRVRIQDNTVTVTADIPPLNLISVENGTGGRQPGKLVFTGNYIAQGDTFRLEQNTTLTITHSSGFSAPPSTTGCIVTSVRSLSDDAVYIFAGGSNQSTGNGLPAQVRGFVVDKTSGSVVTLTTSVQIKDSLVINDGVLDLGSYSINGQTAGRTLIMRGGELIVRQSFPTNYTPPTFSAGRVTFDGTGNVTIPSSGSTPGVNRYYDLKIAGNPRSGNVVFESNGEIAIYNSLDISNLNFANNTYRFLTNGSTVRFCKNGGTQYVPLKPASPFDTVVFLEYYNLKLDSAGTKQLTASGSPTFKVLNNLTIDNGATFSANNFVLEVQGSWLNANSSVFIPGSGTVIFRNTNSLTTNTITVRDTSDNPFNNVYIAGSGIVEALDNIKILGNLTIDTLSTFKMTTNFMSLYGNWTNKGGSFNYGTSTVSFNGNSLQTISKSSGNENYYNLIINNSANVDASSVGFAGNGIIVNNNLNLTNGILKARSGSNYRFVTVLGTLSRPGGGFVDGELRKPVGTGTTSVTYEIGYGTRYTPVYFNVSGGGGSSGLVAARSDTINTTTSPISWNTDPPTAILPAGSGMSPQKHVARQYTISIPTGSTFALGSNRKYVATFTFIGTAAPNGDLRNGANPSIFEARLRSGTNWIRPYFYGSYPFIGNRTTNTLEFDSLVDFGTFIVGEPDILTFYSRANGNWTTASNWSTIGYGGSPASEYPGQTTPNFRAYIGNGNSITMNQNITINNSPTGDTCWVQVDSSGYLNFDTYLLTGTGAFRLAKDGAIQTNHPECFRATGAFGNVRTSIRDYNFGNHGRGHFVYGGSSNQTQNNEALPNNVASVRVNKTANSVTFNRSVTIADSLYIQSGSLTLGANLTINGNIRRNSGAGFSPGTTTITISGAQGDTITNLDSNPLNFYNLTIAKNSGTGSVVLASNTAILITNQLTFSTSGTNKSIIEAQSWKGAYVQIANGASVLNASISRGWIYGDLRKWIPAGDAPAITFEVGDSLRYSPFMIDFRSGTNNGTAGYLSVEVFPGVHPYMDLTYNPPVAPNRLIGPKWWRLKQPQGSTFQRGNRNFDPRAYFQSPGDDANVDYWGCVDLTYCRKWTGGVQWQALYPNSTNSNDGAYSCADTRQAGLTPNFTYSGALSGGLAYVNVANVNTPFGSTEIISGDTLLGDFVSGNQNSIARFYTFYSVRDGDWTDPSTWSTVSLDDTLNPTNLAASDTTGGRNRIIYGFPRRQYDNAVIGRGKEVRLDANIGTNTLTDISTLELNALAGPSVVVRDSGILDLNYHVLRGMSFEIKNGGKIISGSTSGITTGNSGNINLFPGTSPSYSDSISITYTAEGYTSDVARYFSTWPNRNGTTYYLERVVVRRSSDNQTLMDNLTLDTLTRSTRCINIYLHKKAVLQAGQTYYLQIDPSNTGGNRRYRVWIDYNRNGSYTDADELVVDQASSSNTIFNTSNFTVPASTLPGSTQMRVGMNSTNTAFGPTDAGTGEFEEYTIDIVNNSPTITQQTGNGLPTILRSFEVHSPRNGSTVQLGKSITVLDSVKVRSGVLNAQTYNLSIYGDFISDTTDGFNPGTGNVFFQLSGTSNIRGTSSNISFYNIYFRKTYLDTINVRTNITVSSIMSLDSSNIVNLFDNNKITIGTNGILTYSGSAFSNKKMIKVSGNSSTGTVVKNFPSATSVTRTFLCPIGIDTVLNQANISITGNYSASSSLEFKLNNGKHPNRLTENILKKYWTLIPTGITNVTASNYQFDFVGDDTAGNIANYIPARYKTGSGWEINLGTSRSISPITGGYRINITNDSTYNGSKIAGDWTAGEPLSFFTGRIFYSRQGGNWNDPLSWSNDPVLKHNGGPAAYYPGQIYNKDTVNIDGHTIYFNVSFAEVDSLRLGGTNSVPAPGQLRFHVKAFGNYKVLKTRQLFLDAEAVRIMPQPEPVSPPTIDTLIVTKNLICNNMGPFGMDLFYQSAATDSHYVVLKFGGTGNSFITGNGLWGSMRSIVIEKSGGLNDTVFVQANGLANSSSSSAKHYFVFKGGVLAKMTTSPAYLYISGLDVFPVSVGQNSGITVFNGSVRSRSSITTDANTVIHLVNGDLYVGEPYQYSSVFGDLNYNSGTTIKIDNGMLWIAFALSRAQTTSTLNFNIGPSGVVKVNANNSGGSYSGKIGFDVSSLGSTFNMSGGRIIVCNGRGTSNATFDINVSAQNGTGMTGGIIQCGDTTITPNGTTIKIGGTLPYYALHCANNSALAVTTKLASSIVTFKNDVTVDVNHTFSLDGNTLVLGGNLTNYGNFVGVPSGPTSNPWRFELNGTANQTLFSNSSNIEVFNLKVNKNSGNVLLSPLGSSNLIVRNDLEFTNSNNAFIDAPIQNGRFVEVSPITGSNPNILRYGLGHINGRLYRFVNSGSQNVFFPVGADTIASYRPLWFETSGAGNTPGLVGVVSFNFVHPDINDANIDLTQYVIRYWKVTTPASGGFQLGSGNTFNLKVQFLNPNDITTGSNASLFRMFNYNPPCPDPPTSCPGTGNWTRIDNTTPTDTTMYATGISIFGDFVVGKPAWVTFWSRNNGMWNDPNTWSLTDYYTDNVPPRVPNQVYDIVRIGNGKTVTLPDGYFPNVYEVWVEKDSINQLPGTLYIQGVLGYLSGTKFVLKDTCTLGVQNQYGLARAVDGNIGAIQTSIRNFGVARYIYNSNLNAQITGLGLPDSIKTLIIDNSYPSNHTVDLSGLITSDPLKIADTLLVRQGNFNLGSRNVAIYNVMILDSVTYEGSLVPGTSEVSFSGTGNKYLILKNHSGANFFKVNIASGTLNINRPVINNAGKQHIYVSNALNFATNNTLIKLNDGINLNVTNPNPNSITNFSNLRYIETSLTSGMLIRAVAANQNYTFPIGSNGYYTPAEFSAASSGATGSIGVRTSRGQSAYQTDGHIGLSPSTAAVYLKRYWTIDSVTAQINGKWTFFYDDADIAGNESEFVKIGRWRPAWESASGSWAFPFSPSTIDILNNKFETSSNFAYSGFYGDWTIGNESAFRRIFFSRQSGFWTSDNSWTWSPTHSGPIAGIGLYPNAPGDSVVIGGGNNGIGNHEITLDVSNPFSSSTGVGVSVGTSQTNTGTLNLGTNILNGQYFKLSEYSTLKIGSPDGISAVGTNLGNIQTTLVRDYSTNGIYVYNGTSNQVIGNGLPSTVFSFIVDNSGTYPNNVVTINKNITVQNDLRVLNGTLDLQSYSMNSTIGSLGTFELSTNARMRVGGTNDLSTTINNYLTYSINTLSIIDFRGTNQVISNLPANLTQDFINNTGGLGTVWLSNSGTKFANSPLLIRGDLVINPGVWLQTSVGVDALAVRGSVINNSSILNEGVIEIGKEP
jgi:hypothetical protein